MSPDDDYRSAASAFFASAFWSFSLIASAYSALAASLRARARLERGVSWSVTAQGIARMRKLAAIARCSRKSAVSLARLLNTTSRCVRGCRTRMMIA